MFQATPAAVYTIKLFNLGSLVLERPLAIDILFLPMQEGGLVKPPAQRDVCAAAGAAWAAMSREEKEPFYEQSEKSKDVWAAHLQELQKPKEKVNQAKC